MIIVKNNKKYGRHILSTKNIKRGTLIEVSDLIIIRSNKEAGLVYKTILNSYVFAYGNFGLAIALGIGSLFNHDPEPNVRYVIKKDKMHYYTTRDVKAGEQLFIDYGYEPEV